MQDAIDALLVYITQDATRSMSEVLDYLDATIDADIVHGLYEDAWPAPAHIDGVDLIAACPAARAVVASWFA